MNVRTLAALCLAMTIAILLVSVPGPGSADVRIICTNSVLDDFTRNVVNGPADIEYIMPAGACPAQFDACPSVVNRIADADVVVSLGWEPWLDDLLEASGNDDAFQVRCSGLGEWNVPSGAKAYVDRIAGGLMDTGIFDNASIEANADRYKVSIDSVAGDLRALVAAHGQVGTPVIVMQWQADFVEWLGYSISASYGPPRGLSTQDVLDIVEAAEDDDVAVVIDNLQSGTDFGSGVSSGSHAIHVIATNFPGAIPGTDTYLDMIQYNTLHIIEGVETHEYRKGDIAALEDRVTDLEVQRAALGAATGILTMIMVLLMVMYRRK